MTFIWPGYRPSAYATSDALLADQAEELDALRGARICNAYSAWEIEAEKWCAEAPIVLELEQAQLEIGFDGESFMSLTINAINLSRTAADTLSSERREHRPRYEWRTDRREMADFIGGFIVGINLLVSTDSEVVLRGMCIQTDKGELCIVNRGTGADAKVSLSPAGIDGEGFKRIIAI